MLTLFMIAHFTHHLMMALLTPLLPYIRNDFSLTYTQAGWLVLAYNIAYGLSQLPAGWLTDRIGPQIMLTIGIAGVATVGFLIGVSPSYLLLLLLLIILGTAGGGYHPAAAPLVSASVEPEHRGRALGLHQLGGTSSFFLAPLIAAGIASALGWRGTFIAVAIPSIVFGITFYILVARLGYTEKPRQGMPNNLEIPPSVNSAKPRKLIGFIILGVASMVIVYSTLSFIPLFVVDNFEGTTNETGAAMLSLAYFGGLWAGPLGGFLSDRVGKVPVILASGFIAAPAIYLLNVAPFGLGLSFLLIIGGMAMHLGMPAVEAYIITHTSERRRSTVLGIYYSSSRGGPAIAPLIGYLIDHYGFSTAFSVVGTSMFVITIICTILLWGERD